MSASLESIGLADIRLLVKLMCLLAVGRVPESCLSVSLVPHAGPASMSVIPDLSFSMFVFYNKRYSDKGIGKTQTRYMPVCRRSLENHVINLYVCNSNSNNSDLYKQTDGTFQCLHSVPT